MNLINSCIFKTNTATGIAAWKVIEKSSIEYNICDFIFFFHKFRIKVVFLFSHTVLCTPKTYRIPPESCKLVQDAPKDISVKDMRSYDVDYARLEFHPNLFLSRKQNRRQSLKEKLTILSYQTIATFSVDGNICIIHWPVLILLSLSNWLGRVTSSISLI